MVDAQSQVNPDDLLLIDNEPSKLSDSIKAITCCKITFYLGNGKDIEDISTCMQLTDEQKGYIGMLPGGQGIAGLSGSVLVPLHLIFPFVPDKIGLVRDFDL